jgi:hypothetical protein
MCSVNESLPENGRVCFAKRTGSNEIISVRFVKDISTQEPHWLFKNSDNCGLKCISHWAYDDDYDQPEADAWISSFPTIDQAIELPEFGDIRPWLRSLKEQGL